VEYLSDPLKQPMRRQLNQFQQKSISEEHQQPEQANFYLKIRSMGMEDFTVFLNRTSGSQNLPLK